MFTCSISLCLLRFDNCFINEYDCCQPAAASASAFCTIHKLTDCISSCSALLFTYRPCKSTIYDYDESFTDGWLAPDGSPFRALPIGKS